MKLGKDTGSLVNLVMGMATNGQPDPVVGMGVTMLSWTDRRAATIIKVDGNVITVQRDHAKRTDANGMSEQQAYEYSPDTEGATYLYRQNKAGQWVGVYRDSKSGRFNQNGSRLRMGERDEYYDFSF